MIKYPVLDFKVSLHLFCEYATNYNQGRELKMQLRPSHIRLFRRILVLLARQLYQRNKLFADTPFFRQLDPIKPMMIHTNRKSLSQIEKNICISGNSAYRQVLRLIESGVIIGKTNHGTRQDFELHINPEVLLINDLSGKNEAQKARQSKAEEPAFQDKLQPKCTPYTVKGKEPFNNSIIEVENVDNPSKKILSPQTLQKNILKEHREIAPQENPKPADKERSTELIGRWNQKQKEQAVAPEKTATPLRQYQKSGARWLFWYAMHQLFNGRMFNPQALVNTLEYVEVHYFTGCLSTQAVDRQQEQFKWRIDKAKNYIQNHAIDSRWIFPKHYFDVGKHGNNPLTGKPYLSFANTGRWLKKYNSQEQNKQQDKQGFMQNLWLQEIIKKYELTPGINQYLQCESLVKQKAPRLHTRFLQQVIQLNQ